MFVTRAEISARNSSRLSDVLQAKRGINLVRLGFGRYGVLFVQPSITLTRDQAQLAARRGLTYRWLYLGEPTSVTVSPNGQPLGQWWRRASLHFAPKTPAS